MNNRTPREKCTDVHCTQMINKLIITNNGSTIVRLVVAYSLRMSHEDKQGSEFLSNEEEADKPACFDISDLLKLNDPDMEKKCREDISQVLYCPVATPLIPQGPGEGGTLRAGEGKRRAAGAWFRRPDPRGRDGSRARGGWAGPGMGQGGGGG